MNHFRTSSRLGLAEAVLRDTHSKVRTVGSKRQLVAINIPMRNADVIPNCFLPQLLPTICVHLVS
jgi:hypothetical protein